MGNIKTSNEMTPKEKAKELIEKFIPHTRIFHKHLRWEDCLDSAKECALITVDEIEKALIDYGSGNSFQLQNMDSEFRYWEQVKQEIEKL